MIQLQSVRRSGLAFWVLLAILGSLLVPANPRALDKDPGWPREIVTSDGKIMIYQPQPEDLKGNVLTGRAATSVLKTGATEPVFGVFWFQGRLDVDRDARTALVSNVKITRVRFPEATPEQEQIYIAIVEYAIPQWRQPISLDRLIASLSAAKEELKSAEGLKNTPPVVLVTEYPSVLVIYDGEPTLRNIPDTNLQRVVNTPYPVIYDPATKTYYLTNTTWWFRATDPMGPWTAGASAPPEVVAAIPKNAKEEAAQDKAPSADSRPPAIVTAKEPTELIWTDGKPEMRSLSADLLYVQNTDGSLFLDVKSNAYYVLLSGRWYSSPSIKGAWTFVKPSELPPSFNTIPPMSAKGPVRASVPGTEESKDAIMDSQIPQTAAIKRGVATDVQVNYDGQAQFKPVESTSLEYAVNTGQQVIKSGDKCYLCQEGVWYVSAGPDGPWSVSDVRPAGVEDIPASNPLYNTKYVDIYDSTDEVVYEGYTPGYEGAYAYDGTVVYGTGWYYPGWVGAYYYPYSWTWGWGAYYSPYYGWGYGGVGWGFAWGFAWGAALSHWGYGSGCWHGGYYGGNINVGNINVGNGNRGQGNRPGGGQGNRPGGGQGNRPSQLPANNRYNRGDNALRNATPDQRAQARQNLSQSPRVSEGRANNVYAGRDGNVYRQQSGGGWEQRGQVGQGGQKGQGGWQKLDVGSARDRQGSGGAQGGVANRPGNADHNFGAGNAGNLNRDAAARSRGTANTNSFNRGGAGGSRGGYSGGRGGGGRGGGGGRRR
jgi:hypothetical protein